MDGNVKFERNGEQKMIRYKKQVFDDTVAVTGVSLDKHDLSLKVGSGTKTLVATVTPATATDPSVTWKSSNTAIATVSSGGVVTPVAAGNCNIMVTTTDGGFFDVCSAKVGSADAYDDEAYCDFSQNAAKAMAGKDLLLAIWNADGTEILAVGGQKSLTINRSADTVEITSKDTEGGWKSYIAGMKEWSIDTDGIYVKNDESHAILSAAFDAGDPVCIKVYDNKRKKGLFGGLAVITDYPIEAPYDDSVTYSLTFSGMGKLVDLTVDVPESDILPS